MQQKRLENDPFAVIEETEGSSRYNRNGVSSCKALALKSDLLASLLAKNGIPPTWPRDPGFESLVRIILEQAVSLESAKAVFEKCEKEMGRISPSSFLAADDQIMVKAGFSRMKWKTCRICAEKVFQGEINLSPTNLKEDMDLENKLTELPGIGPWTVDIYFLLVLQRSNIWPVADRALAVAVSQVLGLKDVLSRTDLIQVAEPWQPYRSWAARIFWHDYLIRRNRLSS
jgi:DNA-3-methyladenine glycosylase II